MTIAIGSGWLTNMPRPLRIEFPGAYGGEAARGRGADGMGGVSAGMATWGGGLLKKRPKGDAGRAQLARLLRRQTPMSRQWIAKRLHTGSASYVSHLTKP